MPDIDLHRGEDIRGVIISLLALFPTFSNRTGGGRKAQGIEEGAIKSLLDTGAETGGECHEQNRKIKRGITPEGCISF